MKRHSMSITGRVLEDESGEWVKYHDAMEEKTQAYSKGIQSGMIQALTGVISEIRSKFDTVDAWYVLKFCETEIERLKKMNPIGE